MNCTLSSEPTFSLIQLVVLFGHPCWSLPYASIAWVLYPLAKSKGTSSSRPGYPSRERATPIGRKRSPRSREARASPQNPQTAGARCEGEELTRTGHCRCTSAMSRTVGNGTLPIASPNVSEWRRYPAFRRGRDLDPSATSQVRQQTAALEGE